MNRKTTIVLFYTIIALFGVVILTIAFWARSGLKKAPPPGPVVNAGAPQAPTWFQIGKDFEGVNQDNKPVKLSDLKGKVWLVAEFFAVCPHCAVRNGSDLRELHEMFKDDPDFHVVCISVDPAADDPEKLQSYSKALGATSDTWWFMNGGDAKATHHYLEHELKFFGVRERIDPLEIEASGRYAHDLGFILVDRDFNVVGKWPIADAKSEEAKKRDPELYARLRKDLEGRIRAELEKK